MKKDSKIENQIEDLAHYYDVELSEILHNLVNGTRVKSKYKEWTLQDCYDMQQFYLLLIKHKYKAAYNKLMYLGKECDLVPHNLYKKLFNMFSEYQLD